MVFNFHRPARVGLVHVARLVRAVAVLTLVAAACGSATAELPQAVNTRPDPFAQWRTIDEGRIASSWSSLPLGEGCTPDVRALSGHAQLLTESSDAWQDTQPGLFSLVEPRHRLQLDATGQWGCVFGQLAVQRQIDASGDHWSWDGSAISWRIDQHWRVGAGRIARQWGPGWDGSLILGTAARPVPSLSVEAASGLLDKDGWWWWLGEVDFSAFLGRLEDERGDYARPYLWGMRLVVRPWPWLQLGASRTAMWGGEGRDNSLKMFLKSVLSRENSCYQPGCSEQPGNQLGGYDARLSLDSWLRGVALYGQIIGEDSRPDDVPFPAKNMYLAGAEWRRDGAMAFVEWTDSTAKAAGVAYNHFIFTDGYRHRGRPLGHWADGDSNLWTVGGLLRQLFGGQALAVLRYGNLNDSSANSTWPDARLSAASLQWRKVFDRDFALTIALDHQELSQSPGVGGPQKWRDTQVRVQLDGWLH
jgi:hypothetical protein